MKKVPNVPPVRIFLDSGIILRGTFVDWGAPKAILILATLRDRYTVVLAEPIEREVRRAVASRTTRLQSDEAQIVVRSIRDWLSRVRIERHASPSDLELRQAIPKILPTLKHANDLPSIVVAMKVHPDWVISDNEDHWNQDLAAPTGLRIVTSLQFLRTLQLPTPG